MNLSAASIVLREYSRSLVVICYYCTHIDSTAQVVLCCSYSASSASSATLLTNDKERRRERERKEGLERDGEERKKRV